ncbi:MAG: hypothetical protein C0490_23720, partial [Marivirga sp.]|nr:hypothetical protein [Marivirga sp.]
ELQLHASQVKKYLILHDTETFGIRGEISEKMGLLPAIEEFLSDNKMWTIKERFANNNGLTILKRCQTE